MPAFRALTGFGATRAVRRELRHRRLVVGVGLGVGEPPAYRRRSAAKPDYEPDLDPEAARSEA